MENLSKLLKRERIKRKIISNHDKARADVFQCIKISYKATT